MGSSLGNQTLLKSLRVIDSIAEGNRDLKQVYTHLKMPKSTVHRIIQGLIEARYVREVKGIGFVLGTKLVQLGIRAQDDMPLKEVANPFLKDLSRITKDTVHLGIVDGDHVFYLDKIPGMRAIQLKSRIGDRLPLSITGVGKSLMVDLPRTEWQRLCKKQCPDVYDDFMMRMEAYSEGGYSFDLEDNEDFVRCVAVPVRNRYGQVIAAISITSIKEYMPDERMLALIPVIKKYCAKISKSLN